MIIWQEREKERGRDSYEKMLNTNPINQHNTHILSVHVLNTTVSIEALICILDVHTLLGVANFAICESSL